MTSNINIDTKMVLEFVNKASSAYMKREEDLMAEACLMLLDTHEKLSQQSIPDKEERAKIGAKGFIAILDKHSSEVVPKEAWEDFMANVLFKDIAFEPWDGPRRDMLI